MSEEKLEEARRVLQQWVDKQGHERCWYYPDLFRELAEILEVEPSKEPALPPLAEFKRGCEKYQKEEFGLDSHTKPF
jgi:hypothetical protein